MSRQRTNAAAVINSSGGGGNPGPVAPGVASSATTGYAIGNKPVGLIASFIDMRFPALTLPGAPGTGRLDLSFREAFPITEPATKIKLVYNQTQTIEGHVGTGTCYAGIGDYLAARVMDFTPAGSVYSGTTLSATFLNRGQNASPINNFNYFGAGSSLIVSEWIDKPVTDGVRLGIETNVAQVYQAAMAGINPRTPLQINPQGGYHDSATYNNGNPASNTATSGNLTIAGTGTPTALGATSKYGPAMVLGKDIPGATRKPVVLVLANSIPGAYTGSIMDMLGQAGCQVISYGHSGSHPRYNWDNDAVDFYAELADLIIMLDTENLLNPQALDYASFFGSATSTDPTPMIDAIKAAVRKWGKPTYWGLPYLLGINTADLTNQVLGPGATNSTGYNMAINYRAAVKAALLADPTLGTALDIYADIIVPSGGALPFIYKSDLLGGGVRGIKAWEFDTANVSSGNPTPANLWAFELEATNPYYSSGGNHFRTAINGAAAPQAWNTPRLTARQFKIFGSGMGGTDASQTSLYANRKYIGCKLVCYDGSPTNTPIGEVRTVHANGMFSAFARSSTFRVDEAPTGGVTYAGSRWRLEIPIIGDNQGLTSLNGLHLNLGAVTFCAARAVENIIMPTINAWARA